MTDPYQGVERKYRLTRGILNTFAEHDYQGRVSILTKSPTVLDDLETLKRIKNAEVGFSITTSDDVLSRKLDAKAPIAHARLDTVKTLVDAGIKSYVFVGPFLPHMYLRPDLIDELFEGISATGVREVKVEYLNLPSYVRPRLREFLKDQPEDIRAVYAKSQKFEYRETLEPVIRDALANKGLQLRFNEIVHHVGDQDLKEKT